MRKEGDKLFYVPIAVLGDIMTSQPSIFVIKRTGVKFLFCHAACDRCKGVAVAAMEDGLWHDILTHFVEVVCWTDLIRHIGKAIAVFAFGISLFNL